MIDDALGEYVDVFGCNEYVAWYSTYDGLPEKIHRVTWQMKYQKPLVITEFGAEAPYGKHGDNLTRWTEEYQENVYQHQVNMLKKNPFPPRRLSLDPDGLPLSPAARCRASRIFTIGKD